MTQVMQLLGHGISHSASPAMWNQIFSSMGADFSYGLRDVDETGLQHALAALHSGEVAFYNVTMPHKAWANHVAELKSPEVAQSRVANTLWLEGGTVASANTDVLAARLLFRDLPEPVESVLVLGAGSTGRSLATASVPSAQRVYVTNRSPARAERLATDIAGVVVVPWHERQAWAAAVDVVVNATPSGLVDDRSPLADLEPSSRTAKVRFFYDLIYGPGHTRLQQQAAEAGMRIVDGLAHLEAHARAMLPMLGLSLSREELRRHVVAALGRAPRDWRIRPSGDEGR